MSADSHESCNACARRAHREELEECFSLEKLRETRSHNESQITACLALLKAAYEDGAMQQFSSHVVRHRYLVKITEEIDAREEELERSAPPSRSQRTVSR